MAYDPPGIPVTGTVISVADWGLKVRNTLLSTGVAQVTTAGDMTYATALNTLARLAPPAAAGALLRYTTLPAWLALGAALKILRVNAGATDVEYVEENLPWLIDIDVFSTAVSHVNFNTLTASTATFVYNAYKSSSAAQNDEINWDVVLGAGTWTVELTHMTDPNQGIYTVQFDGVTKGTIDAYSGGQVNNVRSTVAAIAVAGTGKVRLKLLIATKNASSAGYQAWLQHVQLRRTA